MFQENYCPLCEMERPVSKMTLRGLCPESLFDKTYTFMLNEKGNALYLGYHTSIIYYEKAEESWVWFDRKDNRSKAVSKRSNDGDFIFQGEHRSRDFFAAWRPPV